MTTGFWFLDCALVGHVVNVLMVYSVIECLAGCLEEGQCLSVNYASSGNFDHKFHCELNDAKGTGNHTDYLMHRLGSTHYSLEEVIARYNEQQWYVHIIILVFFSANLFTKSCSYI